MSSASSSGTSGTERADVDVVAGDRLFIRIKGANPDVDFRLTNLLTITGSSAVVSGTAGDDSLRWQAGGQQQLEINGVSYALAANVANPFYGIPQYNTTALANPTTQVSQLLLPYPQFTGVTSTDGSGFSWYHGLGVHAERRFGNNFSAQANYTWSKMMQAVDRMNGIQSPLAHSISQFDRPHVLNVNGVFEFPFGKGKQLLNGVPGWANHIVGNWSVNVLYVAQSGPPMNFGNVAFYGNLQDIVLPRSERTVARFFNTGAGFNTNSAQQLSTNYRTFPLYLTGARNPGWNDWSMNLLKRFQLKERLHLELRAQFTNAFNHPNFGGPNLSPTSVQFGQITSSTARTIGLQGQMQW
jgi:hypothetical protein